MTNQCQDRDLLAIEPGLFAGGGFDNQQLAAGSDGALAGTAFTSAAAGFVNSAVQPGMVLSVYATVPAEARCYEVIAVDSATHLTVSVIRADADASAVAPPEGTGLKFFITTLGPQIAAAQRALCEKLRLTGEAAGIAPADYAASSQFRVAVALAALASIFIARTSTGEPGDANRVKAEFYRLRHVEALTQLRLASDADGDGLAETTRSLGNVSLRRA
jgi:hypothetical protein